MQEDGRTGGWKNVLRKKRIHEISMNEFFAGEILEKWTGL